MLFGRDFCDNCLLRSSHFATSSRVIWIPCESLNSNALFQMAEQQRQRRRRHAFDAPDLAERLRPGLSQAMADLI